MNAFFIFPASVGGLFSTHPPMEKRIAALQRLESQLPGSAWSLSMGLLDILRGKRELKQPAADRLFAMSTAYVKLEVELELTRPARPRSSSSRSPRPTSRASCATWRRS